jgi:hypothetical protein
LANAYFINGNIDEGKKALVKCQKFQWPKKHCSEYLENNVPEYNYLEVGHFKNVLHYYQKAE